MGVQTNLYTPQSAGLHSSQPPYWKVFGLPKEAHVLSRGQKEGQQSYKAQDHDQTCTRLLDDGHRAYQEAHELLGGLQKHLQGQCTHQEEFPEAVKTVRGNEMWAIICLFCPFAASNDGYAYKHLAASHLNILWGCGECYNYANNNLSSFHQHMDRHSEEPASSTHGELGKEDQDGSNQKDEPEEEEGEPDDKGSGSEDSLGSKDSEQESEANDGNEGDASDQGSASAPGSSSNSE